MTDLGSPRSDGGVADLAGRPVSLRAGRLQAVVQAGNLRWLTLDGVELIRALHGAVRDPVWATIEPTFERYEVEEASGAFDVRFRARHERDDIAFVWDGTVRGDEAGLRFDFVGEALRPFLRARIGLCVLHPPELAGTPLEVETPWGSLHGRFPELIAPLPVFTNMRSLVTHPRDAWSVEFTFEGDLFEMEDQRNWSDASFKTYSTPTCLPIPARVEQGQVVRQSVSVRISAPPRRRASRRRSPLLGSHELTSRKPPRIGVAAPPPDTPVLESELELLRALELDHLRSVVDVEGDRRVAGRDARLAAGLEAGVELELVVGPGSSDELVTGVLREISERTRVDRVLIFDRSSHVTPASAVDRLRPILAHHLPGCPVGGGSRTDFAQLNAAPPPAGLLDVVAFAVSPQVHAIDDETVMENAEAQSAAVAAAHALTGAEVAVGPVSLRPRFNPNGPPPAAGEAAVFGPERLDGRQSTSFAAAWTVASLATLIASDASSITLFELTGPAGLLATESEGDRPEVFPVYGVLTRVRWLRELRRMTGLLRPREAALIVSGGGSSIRALLANLRADPRVEAIGLSGQRVEITSLLSGERSSVPIDAEGSVSVELRPYEVMALEVAR